MREKWGASLCRHSTHCSLTSQQQQPGFSLVDLFLLLHQLLLLSLCCGRALPNNSNLISIKAVLTPNCETMGGRKPYGS